MSKAQEKIISASQYNKLFDYAVSATNADFPFLFTVTTNFLNRGKIVRSVIEHEEREKQLRERIIRTTISDGKKIAEFEVRAGFKNNFCSSDGSVWVRSEYICLSPVSFYGPETPSTVTRYVRKARSNGKSIRILRELTILRPTKNNERRRFRESKSVLDGRGFFISVTDTEGLLGPRTVTVVRTQVWKKKRFAPITEPVAKYE